MAAARKEPAGNRGKRSKKPSGSPRRRRGVKLRPTELAADLAVSTWGRALRASPASTVQFQFRQNVEHFIAKQGPRLWGRTFDVAVAIRRFHRAARITRSDPGHAR